MVGVCLMYKAKRLKHEEAAAPSQRKNDFVRTVVVHYLLVMESRNHFDCDAEEN